MQDDPILPIEDTQQTNSNVPVSSDTTTPPADVAEEGSETSPDAYYGEEEKADDEELDLTFLDAE